MNETGSQPFSSDSLTVLTVLAVVAALYFGRGLLIPLAFSIVLAFLIVPLAHLFERIRLGRAGSATLAIVLALAIVGSLGWIVIRQLSQIVEQFPTYRTNIHEKFSELRLSKRSGLTHANEAVTALSGEIRDASTAATGAAAEKQAHKPVPVLIAPASGPSDLGQTIIGPLATILETSGMVMVFTLFMVVRRDNLEDRLVRLASDKHRNVALVAIGETSQRLRRYFLLLFAVNAGYGLIFGGAVALLGIPHPLLWGVLACLLRFVPYLGAPLAAAFAAFMAVAVFPGWREAIAVIFIYAVLELLLSNFIEPWLYGAHTGISPLAILVTALFWATIWGPSGLILSTPLTVCLVILGHYVPQLRFLEVILSDEPAVDQKAVQLEETMAHF